MKGKISFIVFCLLLLLVTMAACTDGGNSDTKTSEADQSSSVNADNPSSNGAKVIRLGSANNEEHTLYKGYQEFKEIVEAETNGEIKVEIYMNGLLGDDRTMIEGLQFGTLEAVGVSTSMLSNWAPPMLTFDLPFAFPNVETAYKVIDGPYGEKVGKLLEKEGIVLLSYMENGFRLLTNNEKEINSISDVEGLKIRTMETPVHLATWEALGASPTPMAYTELFTAMQQGVIDGQENPYGNTAMDKFFEVQKYLTETNHVYNPMGLVISKQFFDNLSEEEKKIVKDAAVEAGKHQRELNQQETEQYKQILIDNGMDITELTPEQFNEFSKATKDVYEEFRSEIGEEYMNEFLGELEKYKN